MPSHTRVQELVSHVEQGRFLDAIHEFYHDEVAVQENNEPPRLGLAAYLDHERQFLAMVQTFHEIRAQSFLVAGDRAAIQWVFDVTLKSGASLHREEIAYQRWEGDTIICERFFYGTGSPAPGVKDEANESLDLARVVVDEGGRITLPSALFRQRSLKTGDQILVTGTSAGLSLRVR